MKTILISILLIICFQLQGQEKYVDINGQTFRIKTMGKGAVAVIFENGMSDSLEAWAAIPDSVATFTRVFLYDRADIGKSDTSRQARTIPNMVAELRSLLEHENIRPPYVLAGHSMGGFLVRYFASEYPDEVKGLFLADPSAEDYWDSMSKKQYRKYQKGGTEWYRTRFEPKYWKEWDTFLANREFMRDLNIPKDMPIIMVSSTLPGWARNQTKIIDGFSNARQIILEGDHYIHRTLPDSTISYIKQLVQP